MPKREGTPCDQLTDVCDVASLWCGEQRMSGDKIKDATRMLIKFCLNNPMIVFDLILAQTQVSVRVLE